MLSVSPGVSAFREVLEDQLFYADKTSFIGEFLKDTPPKVSLITRPRRFGKSLTMSMLAEFFDIRKDSRAIFSGLHVSEDRDLCAKWMNKWPVLAISFKEVRGETFRNALFQFGELAGQSCSENLFLLESPRTGAREKKRIASIYDGTASEDETGTVLQTLCQALYQHYNEKVIVLVDEYDVPLAKAQEQGYYNKMYSFMQSVLGGLLKDNTKLKFAILTGCLRMAKESSYTGLNNITCYSISDADFADKIGFTAKDVRKLLADTGLSHKEEEIRTWYDGYCFGRHNDMYCPWDVLQYVRKLQSEPESMPSPFWINSGSSNVVKICIGRTDYAVDDEIAALLDGEVIEKELNEQLTYDELEASENNLWTLLYLTGYLTKAADYEPAEQNAMPLRIPNREVHEIFARKIGEWFCDRVQGTDLRPLYDALWSSDAVAFAEILSSLLMDTMSYHDYKEVYYHAILAGLLRAKYIVRSNYESGLGRSDLIVRDATNKRCAVIEVKRSASPDSMEEDAGRAMLQIQSQKYAAPLVSESRTVIAWGMAFNRKSCVAVCRQEA